MKINFSDKDKTIIDGVHNKFRDIDANEIKNAVNANAPNNIAFSFSIPFNLGVAVMSAYTVSGASSFSINSSGATAGMGTILRVTADGSNIPNFSAFKKVGAGGYSNINGTINQIVFYYDGYDYCASFNQISTIIAPSPTPTPTPSPTIGISPTPTPTLTASVTVTPTNTVTPTVTPTIGVSVTPTVTPTLTASVTPTATVTPTVTPTVTASVTPTITPTITPSTSLPSSTFLIAGTPGTGSITESPSHQYNQTTGSPYFVFTTHLPASTDGEIVWDIPDDNACTVPIGLDDVSTVNDYNTPWLFTAYRETGTNKLVSSERGQSSTFNVVTNPVTSTHQIKMKRVGTTVTEWYSTDSGANFSLIHTYAAASSGILYPKCRMGGSGFGIKVVNARAINFV